MDGAAVVVLLVVAVPLVWWGGRRAGRSRSEIALRLAFVCWMVALAYLVFFPLPLPPYDVPAEFLESYRGWPYPWVGPVPFETIVSSLEQGWSFPAGKFLVGNIGAFVPLGLLAPAIWPRWRSWPRALLLGLLVSGIVEAAQLALSLAMGFPWRVADVDDLILNTLGTLIGFACWVLGSAVVGTRQSASSAS
jgi:glycopeptide antibiotics resistance protein